MGMGRVASFIITPNGKQPKCPLTSKWINKQINWIHPGNRKLLSDKQSKLLTQARTQMNLKSVMLSKKKSDTSHYIRYDPINVTF